MEEKKERKREITRGERGITRERGGERERERETTTKRFQRKREAGRERGNTDREKERTFISFKMGKNALFHLKGYCNAEGKIVNDIMIRY